MSKRICSIDGCESPHRARGLCINHYNWASRPEGRPLGPRRSSEDRFWENVGKRSGCWDWTGYIYPTGYPYFSGGGQRYAHRFSYELFKGPIPDGMDIDHVCHNRACVNPYHLRVVTRKQNNEHRRGAQKNSKTGIRNVHQIGPKDRPYVVQVGHNKKIIKKGPFASIEEANRVAVSLRSKLFTHDDAPIPQ